MVKDEGPYEITSCLYTTPLCMVTTPTFALIKSPSSLYIFTRKAADGQLLSNFLVPAAAFITFSDT